MRHETKTWIYPMIILGILFVILNLCKKNPAVQIPVLSSTEASNLTSTTAMSGGNISNDGGATVTARGVCWGTGNSPTIADSKTIDGSGVGIFKSNITGLITNTTYYVRAYATNSAGTGYGNILSFTTQLVVTDIDGNVYHTITIGKQTWMVENLKTTRYRDGEPIQNVTDYIAWASLTKGAYCNYENNSGNAATFGRLYNWYSVNDKRNITPVGWHIPSDAEWEILINYLGGESVAGGKLKEAGTSHWDNPNTGATTETGFTALPGGYRYYENGSFSGIGKYGYWWCSSESSTFYAWFRCIPNSNRDVIRLNYYKKYGFSVRCLKDY